MSGYDREDELYDNWRDLMMDKYNPWETRRLSIELKRLREEQEVRLAGFERGLMNWPLVPSPTFPGEKTLGCPLCLATDITMTTAPGPSGTAPGGRWRMGDPGGAEVLLCNQCGYKTTKPAR